MDKSNIYIEYINESLSLLINASETMKYKYLFAAMLILTTLFLFGAAAAGESVSHDANSTGDAYLYVDDEITAFNSDRSVSISDDVQNNITDNGDLTADMNIGEVKKNTFGINEISFDVPMIITAKATEGTVKNAKVLIIMPEEFEFVSYDADMGSYDHESGTWIIGDLKSGEAASLTIFTSINQKGNYLISINSTADSNDTDLANNNLECIIEVTSKISSNVTRTSADRSSIQHTAHYGSMAKGINRPAFSDDTAEQDENSPSADPGREDNPTPQPGDEGKKEDKNPGDGSEKRNPQGGGEDSQEESSSDTVSKEITTGTVTSALRSITDAIDDILNPGSDNDFFDSSRIIKAIRSNDYITIPILIFALFLIGLIGEIAYGKIKS